MCCLQCLHLWGTVPLFVDRAPGAYLPRMVEPFADYETERRNARVGAHVVAPHPRYVSFARACHLPARGAVVAFRHFQLAQ